VDKPAPHVLDRDDLSVLTGSAEGVVEAVSYAPERTPEVLADGRPGARWRNAMGLSEPSARLGAAIESMERALGALEVADGEPTWDALLAATAQDPHDEEPLDSLVRRVLLAMLEERRTRRPDSAPAQGTRA
jgi:hypothetical protein